MTSEQEVADKPGRFKYEILFMNFLKYTFLVNSGYDSTLTMTILHMFQIFKSNACSVKVRFDYSEMHTNTLELSLIGIVVWLVFDSNLVNLAIYLSTVAIVCIGKYRAVQCNDNIIDTNVLWIILIKTFSNLNWLEFGFIIAKFRVTSPYLVFWVSKGLMMLFYEL